MIHHSHLLSTLLHSRVTLAAENQTVDDVPERNQAQTCFADDCALLDFFTRGFFCVLLTCN